MPDDSKTENALPVRVKPVVRAQGWKCDLGNGQYDHDWQYRHDWGGDPNVPNGTFECGYWVCRACGAEDQERPAPQYDDETQ